jgi:hypothetical protein
MIFLLYTFWTIRFEDVVLWSVLPLSEWVVQPAGGQQEVGEEAAAKFRFIPHFRHVYVHIFLLILPYPF